MSTSGAQSYLKHVSTLSDSDIDVAATALSMAAMMQGGLKLERYHNHLKKLSDEVAERYAALCESGAKDTVETQLAALKHILSDKHNYISDESQNIQSADLARTIDRGQGGSMALAVLYLHVARGQGWTCEPLNMAGYFLCRLEKDSARLVFDPGQTCKVIEAHDMRQIVKQQQGASAELSASYYEPVSNRSVLIHLQNVIKHRQIEVEDYQGALKSVEMMRLVDPQEYRLLLDAGVLYARTDQPREAIDVLEDYIKQAPDARDQQEAQILLLQLKEDLL